VTTDGKFLRSFGESHDHKNQKPGQHLEPTSLTFDHQNNLLVLNRNGGRGWLNVFDSETDQFKLTITDIGHEPETQNLKDSRCVAVDHAGNYLIAETSMFFLPLLWTLPSPEAVVQQKSGFKCLEVPKIPFISQFLDVLPLSH